MISVQSLEALAVLKSHDLHKGERRVQDKRGVPSELQEEVAEYLSHAMPRQHATFFASLPYFALAALNPQGYPIPTLLTNPTAGQEARLAPVVQQVPSPYALSLSGLVSPHDPFLETLVQEPNSGAERSRPTAPSTGPSPLASLPLFAALGLDFSNRRRNKLSGRLLSSAVASTKGPIEDRPALHEFRERCLREAPSAETAMPNGWVNVHAALLSAENIGNCPKYITVRDVVFGNKGPPLLRYSGAELTQECRHHINQCSTLYIATRHAGLNAECAEPSRDLGLNHRGGPKGFARVLDVSTPTPEPTPPAKSARADGDSSASAKALKPAAEGASFGANLLPPGTYIVLPDYSGNRIYQSLGNIEVEAQVGLLFPDFVAGATLHVLGEARNLYDDEATAIMPRCSLLTVVRVVQAVLQERSLPLALRGGTEESFSPYNPPLRLLAAESSSQRNENHAAPDAAKFRASLVSTTTLSDSLAAFEFEIPEITFPGNVLPAAGTYGIFDCSALFPGRHYEHMNERTPQQINDDYIRSWTLTDVNWLDEASDSTNRRGARVKLLIRHKPNGAVSGALHRLKQLPRKAIPALEFIGVGCDMPLQSQTAAVDAKVAPREGPWPKMLWVAAGVGITPFLAYSSRLAALCAKPGSPDPSLAPLPEVTLLLSCREADRAGLERALVGRLPFVPTPVPSASTTLALVTVVTDAAPGKRRIGEADFKGVPDLGQREVYLCGPPAFAAQAREWLTKLGVPASRIHQENFGF